MTGAKTIDCPCCGGTVAVRAAGYTVSLACQYCGALLDVANPDVRVIAQYHQAVAQLSLPLGSRGTLFDVEWEAIGWQERQSSDAVWTEYLLFNPYAGYRWLVHAEGHWQFGTMLTETPERFAENTVMWRGQGWQQTDPPVTTVTNRVLGEFYWRVQAGEQVGAAEYGHGNDTLSLEHNADEINWTHLVALRPSEVRNSFQAPPGDRNTASDAPDDETVATRGGWWARWTDLPAYGENDVAIMAWTAAFALLVVLTGMLTFGAVTQAISHQLTVPIDGPAAQITIGTVAIERSSQNIRLIAQADGSFINAWVDCDYALVNRATQQAIRADGTVEFYAGRDTDGSRWTEGDGKLTLDVASVPRGTYDVVVQAQGHHWADPKATATTTNGWDSVINDTHDLTFTANVGGVELGVFFTIMALLLTPPAVLLYWQMKQRQNT